MRIIAGRHRGRPLTVPKGRDLRPTADRVREAVFNVLIHGGGRTGVQMRSKAHECWTPSPGPAR